MANLLRFPRAGGGATLVAAALLAASCGGAKSTKVANANQPGTGAQKVQVTTARAVARNVPSYLQATGSLVADEQSDVAPEASGQVVAVTANVGEFVGTGAILARLNDRDAQLRLQQAQAGISQAEAAVRQAQARLGLAPGERFDPNSVPEVLAAQRTVEASQAQEQTLAAQVNNAEAQARLAEDTLARFTNLLETGDTSRLVYNQYRTQAEQARAQVNAVKSQMNEARARTNQARQQLAAARNAARSNNQSIETAQANLDNARAQVGLAQKAVNDTTVRAPFAGFISERSVAVGEYVTPSSRIATLLRTNPIKVSLQLPEAQAGRISLGQSVSVSVAAYKDRNFAGNVTAINPALNAEARAVIVEAQIENPDNALRPNMFATARILQGDSAQRVFVPVAAVLADPDTNTASVYVVADGKAQARAVQTGAQEGEEIQILSGLKEGETVATGNLKQLFDGATVSE